MAVYHSESIHDLQHFYPSDKRTMSQLLEFFQKSQKKSKPYWLLLSLSGISSNHRRAYLSVVRSELLWLQPVRNIKPDFKEYQKTPPSPRENKSKANKQKTKQKKKNKIKTKTTPPPKKNK